MKATRPIVCLACGRLYIHGDPDALHCCPDCGDVSWAFLDDLLNDVLPSGSPYLSWLNQRMSAACQRAATIANPRRQRRIDLRLADLIRNGGRS